MCGAWSARYARRLACGALNKKAFDLLCHFMVFNMFYMQRTDAISPAGLKRL